MTLRFHVCCLKTSCGHSEKQTHSCCTWKQGGTSGFLAPPQAPHGQGQWPTGPEGNWGCRNEAELPRTGSPAGAQPAPALLEKVPCRLEHRCGCAGRECPEGLIGGPRRPARGQAPSLGECTPGAAEQPVSRLVARQALSALSLAVQTAEAQERPLSAEPGHRSSRLRVSQSEAPGWRSLALQGGGRMEGRLAPSTSQAGALPLSSGHVPNTLSSCQPGARPESSRRT